MVGTQAALWHRQTAFFHPKVTRQARAALLAAGVTGALMSFEEHPYIDAEHVYVLDWDHWRGLAGAGALLVRIGPGNPAITTYKLQAAATYSPSSG